MEQEEKIVETVATDGALVEEERVNEEVEQPAEKMVPQSKVDELVGTARKEGRESGIRHLFDEIGVQSMEELHDLIEKGRHFDELHEAYEKREAETQSAIEENALMRAGITPDRWADARMIIKGNNMQVTEEAIAELLPTHPEWKKVERVEDVERFGVSRSDYGKPAVDEKEYVMEHIFKLGKN